MNEILTKELNFKDLLSEWEEYKKSKEFNDLKGTRNDMIKNVKEEFKKWKEGKANPEQTYEKIINKLNNVYVGIKRKIPKNKKTFFQSINEILRKVENNEDWEGSYVNLVHKQRNNVGKVKATALLFALNNEKFCFVLNDDIEKVIKTIICRKGIIKPEKVKRCSKYPCFIKVMEEVKNNLEIGDSVDFDIFLWWLKEHEGNESKQKEQLDRKKKNKRKENKITINNVFFPEDYLKDLLVSVLAKPFVILAGITGTGKSLVAKEFAKAICAKHILIPVRPDWTDSSGLLGYKNVFTNQWVSTPFLEFILAADKDKDTPYVAILDEMNLARVEYYFSDFLSVLEDKERRTSGMNIEKLPMAVTYKGENWKWEWFNNLIKGNSSENKKRGSLLFKKCNDGRLSEPINNIKDVSEGETYYINLEFPQRLPSNLIVIGTVNMDETTYAFSPKVLDRANTIEFVSVDLGKFEESPRSSSVTLKKSYEVIIEELCSKGIDWRDKLWEKNKFKKFKKDKNKFTEKLNKLNEILAKRNFHFGYRTYQEIWFYLYWWKQVFGDENLDTALDFQILQKILPKINGSSERIGDLLDELINELLNENDKRESILNKEDAKHMDEDDVEKAIEKMRKIVCELDFPGSKECSKKEENNDSDNGKNENSYVPEYPRSLYKLLRMKERLMKFDTTSFYEY